MDRRSFILGAGLGAASVTAAGGFSAFQSAPKTDRSRDFLPYGGGPNTPDNAEPFELAFEHLVASGGGTLVIKQPGLYKFGRGCRELSIAADVGVDIRWGPGVRFVGPKGLTMPLLRFRGAAGSRRIGTLQLFDPCIDVSLGALNGNQPSAIHLVNLESVSVQRPKIFGGQLWEDAIVGGDSGIESINIQDFTCVGGSINGFADAGVYWGGGNDPSPIDDGGRLLVYGTIFRHCRTGIVGKRNGYLGVVRNCYMEHCGIGIATADAGSGQNGDTAQRLDIQGCTIKYSSYRGVEFRAKTKGMLLGNTIEDWGYSESGSTLLPSPNQRCAVFLNGSNDVVVTGNTMRMADWIASDHVGILESEYSDQAGRLHVGGGNYGQGNVFINVSKSIQRNSSILKQSFFRL